jgi:hypothetical protein
MQKIINGLLRWLIRLVAIVLPRDKAIALERWRRGREEYARFSNCDYVFASYGKAGRTWVRVMISRYYQLAYRLPETMVIDFDNFHRLNRAIPRVFFTHDNYLREYAGHPEDNRIYYDKKTVLLVRRPQDVVVSQYFQWKFRMRPEKKVINKYPPHGAEVSMYEFAMDPHQGLPAIVAHMNRWAREMPRMKQCLVVRYEDLRARTTEEMARIMRFLGVEPDEALLNDAVEFASIASLREKERSNYFAGSGSRVQARDIKNPDSYKVRRAKVGGYRDYFDDEQLAAIDALVERELLPDFGYTAASAPTAASA